MFAALFDMDGVLADTEGLICEATIRMFEDLYAVRMKPEDFVPYVGTGAIRYVEGPASDYGVSIDTEVAIARRHENFVEILNSGRDIAFPGVRELLKAIWQDPEWKMSLATSTPLDTAQVTLRAAQIDPACFDALIHGGLVAKKKPDPEIFIKAAGACGIDPVFCVAIEDSIAGVASGKAAGMKVLGVTNTFTPEQLNGADLLVDTLEVVTVNRLKQLIKNH